MLQNENVNSNESVSFENEKELLLWKLLEYIKASGCKALVCSQSKSHLTTICNKFGGLQETTMENGIKLFHGDEEFVRLDGETSADDRLLFQIVINSDQGELPISVGYFTSKTGGTGLNLQGANYLIILDTGWNP